MDCLGSGHFRLNMARMMLKKSIPFLCDEEMYGFIIVADLFLDSGQRF